MGKNSFGRIQREGDAAISVLLSMLLLECNVAVAAQRTARSAAISALLNGGVCGHTLVALVACGRRAALVLRLQLARRDQPSSSRIGPAPRRVVA